MEKTAHAESCRESRKTDKYAVLAGYVSLTQWAIWSFGRERTRTTLVFALTLCYTGLRAEVGYPCAQVMAKLDEPRCQLKRDSYQQNQVAAHIDSFRHKMIQIE